MEIEVGEYIRTKQGTIGKAIEKYEKYCVIANTRGEIDVPYENIFKYSKNIIDLVERGDFVNGEYVMQISENIKAYGDKTIITECSNRYFGSQIIGIVTKQQFSNMEYRV